MYLLPWHFYPDYAFVQAWFQVTGRFLGFVFWEDTCDFQTLVTFLFFPSVTSFHPWHLWAPPHHPNRTHSAQVDSCSEICSHILTPTIASALNGWTHPEVYTPALSSSLFFHIKCCKCDAKNGSFIHDEWYSDSKLFRLTTFASGWTEQNKEIKAEWFECLSDLFSIQFWHNLSFFSVSALLDLVSSSFLPVPSLVHEVSV